MRIRVPIFVLLLAAAVAACVSIVLAEPAFTGKNETTRAVDRPRGNE